MNKKDLAKNAFLRYKKRLQDRIDNLDKIEKVIINCYDLARNDGELNVINMFVEKQIDLSVAEIK